MAAAWRPQLAKRICRLCKKEFEVGRFDARTFECPDCRQDPRKGVSGRTFLTPEDLKAKEKKSKQKRRKRYRDTGR